MHWRARRRAAYAQARVGDLAAAERTAETITSDRDTKECAYGHIVAAQVDAGDMDKALDTFHTLSRNWGHWRLVPALIKKGEFGTAKAVAETDISELCLIALSQPYAGDKVGARKTFQMAKAASGGYKRAEMLSKIAQTEARSGDMAAARETIQLAESSVGIEDGLFSGEADAKREEHRAIAAARVAVQDVLNLRAWIRSLDDPVAQSYAWLGAAEGLLPWENEFTVRPVKAD